MTVRMAAGIAVLALTAGAVGAEASPSLVDRALADPALAWRSFGDDEVRVYFQPGSFAERHRVMLLRSARAALDAGRDFLGLAPGGRTVRVLYVDDRAQMERLIGHTYTGWADTAGHGVVLVCNPEWRAFDTHEIAHLLTLGRWGPPAAGGGWLVEALPIAVDGWCQTADVDRVASYLVAHDRWPGLTAFTADPTALGEIPAGMFGASLLRYLRDRFGPGILETIWRAGLAAALTAHGLDSGRLERDWRAWLADPADPLTDDQWQSIAAGGCG